MQEKIFLTTKELSERWGGSPSVHTLDRWRSEKKGPPFVKMGGIKYRLSDIIKYENSL